MRKTCLRSLSGRGTRFGPSRPAPSLTRIPGWLSSRLRRSTRCPAQRSWSASGSGCPRDKSCRQGLHPAGRYLHSRRRVTNSIRVWGVAGSESSCRASSGAGRRVAYPRRVWRRSRPCFRAGVPRGRGRRAAALPVATTLHAGVSLGSPLGPVLAACESTKTRRRSLGGAYAMPDATTTATPDTTSAQCGPSSRSPAPLPCRLLTATSSSRRVALADGTRLSYG